MQRPPSGEDSERLMAVIIDGIREKKGKDIVSLDLRGIANTVCDFFVICSGDSNTHVEGISGSIEETVRKQLKDKPWHVEGMGNSEWVLLDYVNVVAHVFQREPREYYGIEHLWADAVRQEHEEQVPAHRPAAAPVKRTVRKPASPKPAPAKASSTKRKPKA